MTWNELYVLTLSLFRFLLFLSLFGKIQIKFQIVCSNQIGNEMIWLIFHKYFQLGYQFSNNYLTFIVIPNCDSTFVFAYIQFFLSFSCILFFEKLRTKVLYFNLFFLRDSSWKNFIWKFDIWLIFLLKILFTIYKNQTKFPERNFMLFYNI